MTVLIEKYEFETARYDNELFKLKRVRRARFRGLVRAVVAFRRMRRRTRKALKRRLEGPKISAFLQLLLDLSPLIHSYKPTTYLLLLFFQMNEGIVCAAFVWNARRPCCSCPAATSASALAAPPNSRPLPSTATAPCAASILKSTLRFTCDKKSEESSRQQSKFRARDNTPASNPS